MPGWPENTQQGTLSDRAGRVCHPSSVVRWVGRSPTVPSGREWNGSQPGQGAAELLSPRPATGSQGQPACRAGEPSGQGEEPPPEGLGGGYPLSQTDPPAVQRARLWAIVWTASQAPLAAKRPEGRWFSPTPYLRSRMAFSISAWRRWSLQFEQLPVPVGDEAMVAVFGEEGQLGTGRRLHPPDDGRTGAASASAWKGVQVVSATSAAPSIQ